MRKVCLLVKVRVVAQIGQLFHGLSCLLLSFSVRVRIMRVVVNRINDRCLAFLLSAALYHRFLLCLLFVLSICQLLLIL